MRHLGGAHRLGGVHQQLCHVQRLVRGVAAGRGCPAVCAVCRTRPPVAGVQEHRPPLGAAAGGAGPTRDACKGSRPGRQKVDGELRLCPVPATVQWLPRPAAVTPPLPPAWVPTLQAVLSLGRRLWVALLGGWEAARLVRVGRLGDRVWLSCHFLKAQQRGRLSATPTRLGCKARFPTARRATARRTGAACGATWAVVRPAAVASDTSAHRAPPPDARPDAGQRSSTPVCMAGTAVQLRAAGVHAVRGWAHTAPCACFQRRAPRKATPAPPRVSARPLGARALGGGRWCVGGPPRRLGAPAHHTCRSPRVGSDVRKFEQNISARSPTCRTPAQGA